jgi:nucleoside permease NupC
VLPFDIPKTWFTAAAGICAIAIGILWISLCRALSKDFKLVLSDHRRVLTMALVNQGLGLCFVGVVLLAIAITGSRYGISGILSYACAGMLFVFGLVAAGTGGRGEYVAFRFGQIGLVFAAMLALVGNTKS